MSNQSTTTDPKLLEELVCPVTKTSLEFDPMGNDGNGALISRQAKLVFPIRDGIPVMLIDEAAPLEK